MKVSEEKALSSTPKWTKLIKLLEPNLWHVLYIVTFYGFAADIDWIEKMSFSNRTKRRFLGCFFCLIFNVFVQINAKEINSRTVLAKHAKTFTPPEERWKKILFFFPLFTSSQKHNLWKTALSRSVLVCLEIKSLFDWRCAHTQLFLPRRTMSNKSIWERRNW